jgi:hypothetical protein
LRDNKLVPDAAFCIDMEDPKQVFHPGTSRSPEEYKIYVFVEDQHWKSMNYAMPKITGNTKYVINELHRFTLGKTVFGALLPEKDCDITSLKWGRLSKIRTFTELFAYVPSAKFCFDLQDQKRIFAKNMQEHDVFPQEHAI